jgi:ABC-2 type transport system permease protein
MGALSIKSGRDEFGRSFRETHDERGNGMSWDKIWALAKKEIRYYFTSLVGYVVLAAFFLATGIFFSLIVLGSRSASMVPVFQNTVILLLFMTPGITMRLWSEEEKNGTAELLRTSPLTLWDIVLGKYLGVCAFFGVMLSSTLVYLLIIVANGNPDWGPIFANYLGYILIALSFFALGLFVSTLSENQIVSMVLTWVLLLVLWIMGAVGNLVTGPTGDFLKSLSIYEQTDDFFKGVIDLTHVLYFFSLIFIGLFFSVKVLESKRS